MALTGVDWLAAHYFAVMMAAAASLVVRVVEAFRNIPTLDDR